MKRQDHIKSGKYRQRLSDKNTSHTRTVLTMCTALMMLFILTSAAQAAWFNSSWQYRKKLTIDNTKVSGTGFIN